MRHVVSAGEGHGGDATASSDPWRGVALGLTVLVVFSLAVLPVALALSRPAGLYGVTQYDDGVYFAASLRLVSGVLPYRDFVLVQPPGITVMLAPFALLSHVLGARHALGLARIATAGVVGVSAALVSVALRHRGLFAAGLGGLALALYPTGYAADHTFLLEPFLVFFSMVGMVLTFSRGEVASPRRVLLGGVAFGVAGSVKSFAVVPLVLVAIVVATRNRRDAVRFALGAAVALAILVGPFLLAAPHAFWHEVVSSQLARNTVRPTPFDNRVFAITGLAYANASLAVGGTATLAAGAALAAVIVAGFVVALTRPASAFEWSALLCAVGVTAIMFVPEQYFDHYALFSAAFLALAVGGVGGHVHDAARALLSRLPEASRSRSLAFASAFLVVVGALASVLVLRSDTSYQKVIVDRFGDPGPAIAATVPAGSCVLSDAETVLVSAGRAGTGPTGCPAILDATGTWLTYDPAHPPGRTGSGPRDPALVELWRSAFSRADYVVLSGICAFRIPWTPSLYQYFDTHYHHVAGPYGLAFERGAPQSPTEDPDLERRCAATR